MFNNEYIAYALIAVGIITLYMAVLNIWRSSRGNLRLQNAVGASYAAEKIEEDSDAESAFSDLCEKLTPKFQNDEVTRKEAMHLLVLAGKNSREALIYFLFFKRVVQPVVLVIGLYLCYNALTTGSGVLDTLPPLIISGIVIIIGIKGANLYITNCRKKREAVLTNSFPEVMDLLLVCIEAGLGLDAALSRVCKELREVHPEAVAELDRTRLELTMLGDRVTALQNLAERTGTSSFGTLVSALIQTEKFGTGLVDTLRVLSEEQRISRLYAIEQKAARIPVLITIPLILFIMPAFIMIILGPPIIRLINQGIIR